MPIPIAEPEFNEVEEQAKAMAVVAKYFDEDIKTADDAHDVLVDNGVHAGFASSFARDMYPETDGDEYN